MKWLDKSSKLSDEIVRLNSLSPHELLGISKDAKIDEIKAAFRRIAKAYHPDKADLFMRKYNEQVFKIMNNAYQKLISNLDELNER